MASIRAIKKDIDYLLHEVISNSYLTIWFHPERRDDVVRVMEEAVALRNDLIARAGNPVEKNNPRLVRRHYGQIRRELLAGADALFRKISELCK
ncbi:MAG: hypothetical protein LBH06_07075 [Rikenellaceae bacterium]|jgi:hypothetical protein|nr:hypothetical protein [Rikenellaceae bacterium]